MKASLFSLISVWQRGWSWRCFRYRPLRARLCLEKKINKLKSPSMQAVCSTRFASDPKWPDTFGLPGLALTLLIFFWKLIEMWMYIVWHHFSFCETGIRHRCESLVFRLSREKLSSWGFKDLIRTQKLKSWDYFLLYRRCQTSIRTNLQQKSKTSAKKGAVWVEWYKYKNGHLDSLHGGAF